MADTITIVSLGTTIHLAGSGQAYDGIGTPWTAQSTSPYEIAANDVTGQRWTLQAAKAQAVYGGGTAFRYGQALRYIGYENVVETIPIQMRGTTNANAVALLEQLRRHLNTTLYSGPCYLAVDLDALSNTVFADIYHADVQETPHFLNDERGLGIIRAVITWTRTPFFTPATKTTIFNATTFSNTLGSGTPNNQSLGTIVGDLRYIGQPMRVYLTGGGLSSVNSVYRKIFMAVNAELTKAITSDAISTTSTTGVDVTTENILINTNAGVKIRVLARVASITSNLELRIRVYHTGEVPIYTSRWIGRSSCGNSANSFLDFGGFQLPWGVKQYNASLPGSAIHIAVSARSTNGSTATGTLDFLEVVSYYTYCTLEYDTQGLTRLVTGSTKAFSTVEIEAGSGMVRTMAPPLALWVSTLDGQIQESLILRGQAPKAIQGAKLYLSWVAGTNGHDTADSISVTAEYAPLYHTLRGNV